MLRISRQTDRRFLENAILAVMLSLVAGSVNASGLLAAGAMTSHMTGNLTRIGEAIAIGKGGAFQPLRYFIFFLAGAMCVTLVVNSVRRWIREPVPLMLLLEAGLLTAVAEAGTTSASPLLVTETLCFSMGWQNALITKLSGAVVRTTHVTGTTTDLGIELAHLVLDPPGFLARVRRDGFWNAVRAVPEQSDLARAALHGTIVICFLIGATVGPILFAHFGYPAMIAPAVVLVVLVFGDLAWRLEWFRFLHHAGRS